MPQGARLIPSFTRYLVLLTVLFFSCSASVNAVEPQKETDSKAAYSALADILSDATSRDALIAELRDSAKTGKPPAEKSASTVPAETRDETFADQHSRVSHHRAEQIGQVDNGAEIPAA